jgi:hypothetical protein
VRAEKEIILVSGSIGGAVKLNMEKADIAINWAGGMGSLD